ncbi:MAG: MucBP domain-containing protein, partial [Clostridiales bacterium]|nr:MucBP domain-containing protein [Clostridiales bacterium]
MNKAVVTRVVAGILMVAITCTSFALSKRYMPVSTDPPENTTKAVETTAAPAPKEEEVEETTVLSDGTVVPVEKKADGSKEEKTTEAPKVTKYTGGALPYFEWAKAQQLSPNYFGESVFIGDSISLRLQMYGGLPGATYMCYGSYGTCNALSGVIKANIWNSIPAGKKRVYIMLGMNDLNRVGVNGAASNMAQLCSLIEQSNPGILIYIQSMTLIIAAKDGTNGRILNNANIRLYNQLLSGVAASHGWYFVDVASVMYDDRGCLKDEYCSDPGSMGMHFTGAGCGAWCWYLMNHCYDPSWAVRTLTVNYVMADGSKAPAAQTVGNLKAGQSYSVASPKVRGYTPNQATVSGTIGTEDQTVTVTYTK